MSGLREEHTQLSFVRQQLKESQDMAQDLQQLIAINREAISLFADSNPHSKDKIVANLRTENALLFRTLLRSATGQRKLEQTVQYIYYTGRPAQNERKGS